jgi:hypothetical protein
LGVLVKNLRWNCVIITCNIRVLTIVSSFAGLRSLKHTRCEKPLCFFLRRDNTVIWTCPIDSTMLSVCYTSKSGCRGNRSCTLIMLSGLLLALFLCSPVLIQRNNE